MYIAPDSDVYLLSGVPLDPTYEHTVWWTSAAAQEEWFTSHATHVFHNVSVQRHAANEIRIEIDPDIALMCNYMTFRNNAFGGKMFYAFIQDVTYVSNNTASITYQLDVMQSWQFEAVIGPCWVEREHAATDVAGDNLMPEPVDTGPMIISTWENSGYFQNYSILLADVFTQS